MWTFVSVNQMIAMLPLLQIEFPSNLYALFKFLAFLNGDLYILESAYSSSLGELQEEPHAVPLDHSLEIIGKYAL